MYKDSNFHHIPVLYHEVLEGLKINPEGIYVDCTAGGGGHSSGILQKLSDQGRLICIDQDKEALSATKLKLESLKNNKAKYTLVNDKFSNLKQILSDLKIEKVDGILADLGVSSHQIDTAERGFSFQRDGALDMRMNLDNPYTAADFVNTATVEEMIAVFRKYGEERFSQRIANAIVEDRIENPFKTTLQLVETIKRVVPAKSKREQHPAKRVFQAIRIYVNGELDEVEKLLESAKDCLNPGGRIAIITFHSLEDRIVKHEFQQWENPCTCPKEFPVCICGATSLGKTIQRKGIVASASDIQDNPRARSARLRVFERK